MGLVASNWNITLLHSRFHNAMTAGTAECPYLPLFQMISFQEFNLEKINKYGENPIIYHFQVFNVPWGKHYIPMIVWVREKSGWFLRLNYSH